MRASDFDKEPTPTAHNWLRVVGVAMAIVLASVVWTFWG